MLVIAKFDRYDMVNNPGDTTASVTIWFSGCSFKCKNCYNKRLWDKGYGIKYSAKETSKIVIDMCNKLNIKSVVLLGGEPLQQDRQELLSLCRLLREANLKIWLYTGYEFDEFKNSQIADCINVVKCGKYIDELKQDGFPASSNQRVYKQADGSFIDITEQFRR